MQWIFLFVVFTLILIAALLIRPRYTFTRDRGAERTLDLRGPTLGVYVVGFILSLIVFSLHIVAAGEVGVVRTFGSWSGR